jgi:hypothetical protein
MPVTMMILRFCIQHLRAGASAGTMVGSNTGIGGKDGTAGKDVE